MATVDKNGLVTAVSIGIAADIPVLRLPKNSFKKDKNPFNGKDRKQKGGGSMSPEAERTAMAEEIWLLYFNQTLLEKGVITESEHRKMQTVIANRRHVPPPKRST